MLFSDVPAAAAKAAGTDAAEGSGSDPGYHLLAGGRSALEKSIGFRPPAQMARRAMSSSLWTGPRASSSIAVRELLR